MKQSEFDSKTAIEQLIEVMNMLRSPDFGCPWDLEQSIRSLVPYTLEEVYEVVEAIEADDVVELEEELGDLLFQVVFYAQIAKEDSQFDFDAVARAITQKLLRRHPHVFPGGKVERFGTKVEIATSEVAANWESIKQQERQEKASRKAKQPNSEASLLEKEGFESRLDNIPNAMPALMRAHKLQMKAARAGFDWEDLKPVLDKMKEEIAEFEVAIRENDSQAISDELGDILFTAVNLARHVEVNPETALRSANARFSARFKWVEKELVKTGLAFESVTVNELDRLWEDAKRQGL